MSNLNRYAVTVRFNREEQLNLAALCEFWGVDAKKAIKFAFEQMVASTKQLQDKLKTEQEAVSDTAAVTPSATEEQAAT